MNPTSPHHRADDRRTRSNAVHEHSDEALDLRDAERETAFAQLFDTHYPRLLRLAVLLGADSDAEDVVAEAFCQLHRHWERLRERGSASAYLRSTVCNLTRMRLRHLQVVRRHTSRSSAGSSVDSPEQLVLLRDDQRAVVDALCQLPTRQREALVLRYWLELSESAIAESMGISPGAVKSHVSRGMAALSRILGAHPSAV